MDPLKEIELPANTKSKNSPKTKSRDTVDPRLIKALAHPVRMRALAILNERIASPNELAKELGEGLSQVSYHVKVLKENDCIELVKTEPRRGAVEHYYRATSRAFLTDRDWQQLPRSVRPGLSAKLVQSIFNEAAAALEEGTFDRRDNRHVSWTPMMVDEQGWKELIEVLNETLEQVGKIRVASSERMAKSGEEGFQASVALLGFESPESEAQTKARRRG